jgi:hypothetical protein
MANLADIIIRKWPSIAGEGPYLRLDLSDEAHRPLSHLGQYDTLVWNPAYPAPKPTLDEILAFETEVDADLAVEAKKRDAAKEFEASAHDATLAALETLTAAVKALASGQAPDKALDDLDASLKVIRSKVG